MYETAEDLDWLQGVLDRSYESAGPHLRGIASPERILNARQIAAHLQGVRQIALATVTAKGEPRVVPVDSFFLRGRFHTSTSPRAVRIGHLRRRPRVSATYFERDEVGITVHGTATLLEQGDEGLDEYDRSWQEVYGKPVFEMYPGVVIARIEPERMFTFAMEPERYPDA